MLWKYEQGEKISFIQPTEKKLFHHISGIQNILLDLSR